MARVILDSSVLIALLSPTDKHHVAAVQATSTNHEYLISAITFTEVLIAPYRKGTAHGDRYSRALISQFGEPISVDRKIAHAAAKLRADKNIKMPDALISATAEINKAQLWSFDKALVKHNSFARLL